MVCRAMRRREVCKGLVTSGVGLAGCERGAGEPAAGGVEPLETVDLPVARTGDAGSLEAALSERRSIRSFSEAVIEERDLGQLLWAAQGVNRPDGGRTCPSAGATYPLEVYALTADGVFRYVPEGHRLEILSSEDVRAQLPSQDYLHVAPLVIVITAVFARTEERYGARAARFVHIEAGHAAHGVLLQAVALGLGATPVGSFDDPVLNGLLGAPVDHEPLYLIPVGHPL